MMFAKIYIAFCMIIFGWAYLDEFVEKRRKAGRHD